MRSIDKQTIILINQLICKLYNQKSVLINESNLDSCFSVFDSYYETEEEIVSAFLRALITAHAFQDANKRTAIVAAWYVKPGTIDSIGLSKLAIQIAQNTDMPIKNICKALYFKNIKESKSVHKYKYMGNVYRFNKNQFYDALNKPVYTTAVSKKQAVNFIKSQLKKFYGFDVTASLLIDEDEVEQID